MVYGEGSSPPTRGTQRVIIRRYNSAGLIPAYAGNTSRLRRVGWRQRAHPRLRGEHMWRRRGRLVGCGSSPPTRGTQWSGTPDNSESGLIPAYAGNTHHSLGSGLSLPAHPRLRGEHIERLPLAIGRKGSSPPTRGTFVPGVAGVVLWGLIPAYAGNTRFSAQCPAGARAHPRLRGEHVALAWSPCTGRGSSPPTRGTQT